MGGTLLEPIEGLFPNNDVYDSNHDNNNNKNDDETIYHLRSSGSNFPAGTANNPSHPLEIVIPYTAVEKFCLRLGDSLDHNGRCGRIADYVATHRAIVLGTVGVLATLFVVVWPLTWDCRRRAHRRRQRKLQKRLQQQQQEQLELEHDVVRGRPPPDETSTLMVPNADATNTYGTSADRAPY